MSVLAKGRRMAQCAYVTSAAALVLTIFFSFCFVDEVNGSEAYAQVSRDGLILGFSAAALTVAFLCAAAGRCRFMKGRIVFRIGFSLTILFFGINPSYSDEK